MSPASSGLKSKPSKRSATLIACISVEILLDLLFIPEDGSKLFLLNTDPFPTKYTALYLRRQILHLIHDFQVKNCITR
jgi:hypothetical protein